MPHDGHHHHEDHAPIEDVEAIGEYEILEQAIRELLVEKGVLTADAIQTQIDEMDSRTPVAGSRIIARAWTDEAYRARLIADPKPALAEMGVTKLDHNPEVKVVADTADRHHVIVCTLCSCYPRVILGMPPAWYKKRAYRSRVVKEPRQVLAEFGTELPDSTTIEVHDSTADLRYLVLPMRPEGTDDWSADQLAELVTRDIMIGVRLPKAA
ncbi:MAG: nitrile hydratase subunit alpha [Alphaproteobacteria bacterium]|jgi:nitrile hydratase subunit alpha|nr:nitrile hydratase subunit alpha [Alphaproteobacteria bacterium]